MCIFFMFFSVSIAYSIIGYNKILSIVPYAVQYEHVGYLFYIQQYVSVGLPWGSVTQNLPALQEVQETWV